MNSLDDIVGLAACSKGKHEWEREMVDVEWSNTKERLPTKCSRCGANWVDPIVYYFHRKSYYHDTD